MGQHKNAGERDAGEVNLFSKCGVKEKDTYEYRNYERDLQCVVQY